MPLCFVVFRTLDISAFNLRSFTADVFRIIVILEPYVSQFLLLDARFYHYYHRESVNEINAFEFRYMKWEKCFAEYYEKWQKIQLK